MPSLFRFILSVILLTATAVSYAQGHKPVKVVGADIPKAKMYFIAEIHSIEESDRFNVAMIEYLATKHGITNIVIERGHAYAYLLNKYINEGDTTLLHYYGNDVIQSCYPQIKAFNATLPASSKLRYFGMDFERMEFVAAVKTILERSEQTRATKLYQYACNVPDSVSRRVYRTQQQIAVRKAVYGEAKRIFSEEKEALKREVKTDYHELERIMENPADESKFSRRDRGMYRNISRELKGQPFLCIVGRYHTQYTRGEVYHSLVKKMVRHDRRNAKNMVIFDEVHRGRFAVMNIWGHDGDATTYDSTPGGPGYFIRKDSVMNAAYRLYRSKDNFTVVHKDVFRPAVTKDNHGINSYYVFFENATKPTGE